MKNQHNLIQICLLTAAFLALPCVVQSQTNAPVVPLQLQLGSNGMNLVVGPLQTNGALFLQMAGDLPTLNANPTPLLQTNTPLPTGLFLQMSQSAGMSTQAFFNATFYPNESVADFGDPETDFTPPPDPTNILLSSGLPTNLVSGQSFPIVFFVSDPNGQPVPLTGTATIMVVSASDGTPHPDATVTPPTGQMTNGFLQMQITVNAMSSLAGYTLALSINPTTQGAIRPQLENTIFLQDSCDLGPVPLQIQQVIYFYQELDQLRAANTDNGSTWNNPLAFVPDKVAGDFGEWRGDTNTRCHHGLDLPAPASSTVSASRSGVVSCVKNFTAGIGGYVVIDHGNGLFSRYVHLGTNNNILVHFGQAVSRGTPIANQLYAPLGHLHFEILSNSQQMPQWGSSLVGVASVPAQDPVLTPGIFTIPQASSAPQIVEFGLTPLNPGKNIVTLYDNYGGDGTIGQVYVFAQISSGPPNQNPGPRSLSFLPEGANIPQTIAPSNDIVIMPYLPSGTDANEGFAKYYLPSTGKANTPDYFRYWFKWDTSSYAASRTGPRSFVLSVQGYSGLTTNYNFTFGPKIVGGLNQLAAQQYQFTNVAYLGTNLLADPSQPDPIFSQPDQYKLEIIQANGLPLSGVTWTENTTPLATNYTKVFTIHTNQAVYTFTLPTTSTAGLTLRVSSLLAPDIGQDVCFCSVGNGMVSIPAGSFTMGDNLDGESDAPVHSVYVSAFCMDKYDVTLALWQQVYNWAIAHGYSFDNAGSGKAANHPVQTVDWFDCVKWSNARSQQAGLTPVYYTDAGFTQVFTNGDSGTTVYANWGANGYRLPTEAEWEKAARGGLSGQRFPWGNTISWSQANYYGDPLSLDQYGFAYDFATAIDYDPAFSSGDSGAYPYTSPVNYFTPNAYGLYDMAGNVWQWCWDWYGAYGSGSDPRGPTSGSGRVLRGGGCYDNAFNCRSALRVNINPADNSNYVGFRSVLTPGQ